MIMSGDARAVRGAKRVEDVAGGIPTGEAAANGTTGDGLSAGQILSTHQ